MAEGVSSAGLMGSTQSPNLSTCYTIHTIMIIMIITVIIIIIVILITLLTCSPNNNSNNNNTNNNNDNNRVTCYIIQTINRPGFLTPSLHHKICVPMGPALGKSSSVTCQERDV